MIVFRGEFHDAAICTYDGRPHWVAAVMRANHVVDTSGHDTAEEARAWLLRELTARGCPYATITETTSEAARAFSARKKEKTS